MTPEQKLLEISEQIAMLLDLINELEDEADLIYATEVRKVDTTTGASGVDNSIS